MAYNKQNKQERLPKKEYFTLRLEQAIQDGLTDKADYYRSRIAQLEKAEEITDKFNKEKKLSKKEYLQLRLKDAECSAIGGNQDQEDYYRSRLAQIEKMEDLAREVEIAEIEAMSDLQRYYDNAVEVIDELTEENKDLKAQLKEAEQTQDERISLQVEGLFGSRDNIEEAFEYAHQVSKGAQSPIHFMTPVFVLYNTIAEQYDLVPKAK